MKFYHLFSDLGAMSCLANGTAYFDFLFGRQNWFYEEDGFPDRPLAQPAVYRYAIGDDREAFCFLHAEDAFGFGPKSYCRDNYQP